MAGALEWRLPPGDTPLEPTWTFWLAGLLDEPAPVLGSTRRCEEVARWLVTLVGALLRAGGVATVRDMHLEPARKMPDNRVQQCWMVLPVASRPASLAVLRWLVDGLNAPPLDETVLQARYFELMETIKPHANPSSNHWRVLQAAYDEGYAVQMLASGMACIGTGVHRRVFDGFITDRTPHHGMRMAQSKHVTARLLRANGFPGGDNVAVQSLAHAEKVASQMGYPLVVKPNDRDRGVGVSADIRSDADLSRAYKLARAESAVVLVERFQPGFTHRFTVVQGRVMRVAKHVAFGVTGDGVSTVAQLVEAAAQTLAQRKRTQRKGLADCSLDAEALGLLTQNGLTPEHVPATGVYVRLRRKDNISAGGTRHTLDLDSVHPDNLRLALNVSELMGLDFAGVDVISPDVSRSWRDGHAMICEVNGNPQLVARDDPDMYKRVLQHVIPQPARVRATLVLRMFAPTPVAQKSWVRRFSAPNSGQGLAMAAGVWIDGVYVGGPSLHGMAAAQSLCANPRALQITILMTVEEVACLGLPLDRLDAVLLPVSHTSTRQARSTRQQAHQMALAVLRPHASKTSYLNEAL